MNHGMTMTTDNAATLANYRALEAEAGIAVRAISLASQDGTMADWLAAKAAASEPCARRDAEMARIRATGWGENGELELPIQGYLSRRHTDPCIVRYDDLR